MQNNTQNSSALLICATPRTGSNLLMLSLAQHPHFRLGGEWLVKRKAGTLYNYNLFKLFYDSRKHHEHQQLIERCKTVFLYREDTEAQISSWIKACETGRWIQDCGEDPIKPPNNMLEQIKGAEQLYGNSDIALSYEQIVSDWQASVNKCLWLVGLKSAYLPMCIKRQSKD